MHPRIVSQRSPPAVYRHFCNFALFRCLLQRSYPNNNFFSIIIWWILDRFSSRVKSIFQSRRIKKPDVTTIGYSGEKNQRGKEALKGSGEGWESLRERLHESIVLKNSRYERAMFSARSLVPRESAHNAIEERTTSDKNMSSCLHSSREVLELFAGITNPNKLDSNLLRRQKKKSNSTKPSLISSPIIKNTSILIPNSYNTARFRKQIFPTRIMLIKMWKQPSVTIPSNNLCP